MILEYVNRQIINQYAYESIPKFYYAKIFYRDLGKSLRDLFIGGEQEGLELHPAFLAEKDEIDSFSVSVNKFYLDSKGNGHELTGKESDAAPSDCVKKPWDELLKDATTWINTLGDSNLHVMTIYEQAAIAILSLFNATGGKSPLWDIQNWSVESVNALKDRKLLKEGAVDIYEEEIYMPETVVTDKAYILEDHHPYFAPFFCYDDVMETVERDFAKCPPATLHEKVDLTKHTLFARGPYSFFEPKNKEVAYFRIARWTR